MTPEQKDEAFFSGMYSALIFGCVAIVLIGLGVFAAQIIGWLRYGAWSPVSTSDAYHWVGLPTKHLGWAGVEKIFGWLGQLPAALTIPVAGACLAAWVTTSMDEHDKTVRNAKLSREHEAKKSA